MQTHDHSADIGGQEGAARLLLWVLLGAAFVVNAYLAAWIYPDNPLVGDLSALVGALLLAAPIFRSALRGLFSGHIHMNELVALAVLAAFVAGDFRTAGVIAFFMLISLVIETRTAEGAQGSIEGLIRLTPATARRLEAAGETVIPALELRPGDRVRVLPGENIPADGRILSGATTLNEAHITGESLPADKGPGAEVFAGANNLTGALEIEVLRVGDDTTLGRVKDLILAAERTRLPIMRIVDRYMGYYTPVILMLAATVWFFTQDWNRVIALLVVSCPCAIILATPSAMVAALSSAARLGVMIKDVADLEAASRLTAFVFDKTGTLTAGELGVSRLAPHGDTEPAALLRAAAALEQNSNHPAARALVALARETGIALPAVADFHEAPGRGVRGRVAEAAVVCGRAAWLAENGLTDPALAADDQGAGEDLSIIFVAMDGQYLGWVGLSDRIRPEARPALAALRDLGARRLAMVTGDRAAVAERVAAEVDCREFEAGCLPEQKVAFVHAVKQAGYRVAFVGDGVNDAPALAAADLGIAMGAAGSDVALHSASVALMNNDLRRLPFLFRLSRATRAVIVQNLGVGLLAIGGGILLSGLGLLSPILAAILHNVGSLIVVFNSARLVRAEE